jgi:hypothetical protein
MSMVLRLLAVTMIACLITLPASADPLPPARYTSGVFPVCAELPVDIAIEPELKSGTAMMMFLGDPVAFAVGSAVAIIENAQAERTLEGLRWPADKQKFASELGDQVIKALDPTVWGTPQPADAASGQCPWKLVIRAEVSLTTDIEAIGVAMRSELRPRTDPSAAPGWVGILLLTVGREDIYYKVSNTRRATAWTSLTEDEVRSMIVEAFDTAGRLVSYDIRERDDERRGRRLRYIVPGGEYARAREVGVREDHRLLRSQAGLLVAQPEWIRAR